MAMAFQCIIPIALASAECPVEQLSVSDILNVVYILYFVPKSGIIYLEIKGFMMFLILVFCLINFVQFSRKFAQFELIYRRDFVQIYV